MGHINDYQENSGTENQLLTSSIRCGKNDHNRITIAANFVLRLNAYIERPFATAFLRHVVASARRRTGSGFGKNTERQGAAKWGTTAAGTQGTFVGRSNSWRQNELFGVSSTESTVGTERSGGRDVTGTGRSSSGVKSFARERRHFHPPDPAPASLSLWSLCRAVLSVFSGFTEVGLTQGETGC